MHEPLSHAWRGNQKLRFLVVGTWNTVFGYLAFLLIYQILGNWLHYLFVAVFAHLLTVTQSFITQRRWVFGIVAPWGTQYLRFNVSHLATLGLALTLLWLLVDRAGLPVLLSQALVAAISVCASYLAHRHYSFRED